MNIASPPPARLRADRLDQARLRGRRARWPSHGARRMLRRRVARGDIRLEARSICRPREVEALTELAAEVAQSLELPALLDPLGDDRESKRAPEGDDRADERPL